MIKNKNKKADIDNLPILNVGLVGHIDHGKTTLLSRLTGKWADSHSEELKRGITIKLGYADMILRNSKGKPLRYMTFVDAPGHEMLMATMLSGAAIMDAAILLIAANEGIMPQTKEHLAALQARDINKIIIVQNKIDLLPKEKIIENYKEIKKFTKGTIAENAPIIPCSAQQGINIDEILKEILKIPEPKRDINSDPVFVVARSFDINKPGTYIKDMRGGVLGGALKRGKLKVGDEIEIKPGLSVKKENKMIYNAVKTKIVSLVRGKHRIKEAGPGGSLAIETSLDPSLTKADALSGNVVGLKNKLPDITSSLKLKFSLFEEVSGEKDHQRTSLIKTTELLMLSVNTTITVGNVIKVNQGEKEVELSLKIPVVGFRGEKVGIARLIQNHWRLIGFGEIL